MQSKISLNVRNELEKTRRLWRLDVIIMRGCQGHEDECCWLPSVPPQCQPFTDRHCRRAETSSLKGTFEIFYVFYYYELHTVLYFLFFIIFFFTFKVIDSAFQAATVSQFTALNKKNHVAETKLARIVNQSLWRLCLFQHIFTHKCLSQIILWYCTEMNGNQCSVMPLIVEAFYIIVLHMTCT